MKLTGHGMNIGRSFHVENVAFVLLNDLSSVSSPNGNHSHGIFMVPDYDSLCTSLSDILNEACELQSIEVNGRNRNVEFFFGGGGGNFFAVVCGIEAANSTYSCTWCKCPAFDRCMGRSAIDATQDNC